jgi:hypothetical protein
VSLGDTLGSMSSDPKSPTEQELAEFDKFLAQDPNDPLVISWFNDAKLRQCKQGGSLRDHLFDIWNARNTHREEIATRLVERTRGVGEMTRDARFFLITFSLVINAFFYGIIISEPASGLPIFGVGIVTNGCLLTAYGMRFNFGRGPLADENPCFWILRQLALPLFIGGASGIVITAFLMNMSPKYDSITGDGTGGIFTVLRIFWADLFH